MNYIVEYIVYLTSAFVSTYSLTEAAAFRYLKKYGGIRLAEEYYDVMHTQSFNDMVESLASFCRRNGGYI